MLRRKSAVQGWESVVQIPALRELLELNVVKTLIQLDARDTKRVYAAYCQRHRSRSFCL
jgi:hypothetical protein